MVMQTRRTYLIGGGAALIALPTAACERTPGADVSAKAKQIGKVIWLAPRRPREEEWHGDQIKGFETHTGLKMDWIWPTEVTGDKMVVLITAGTPPDVVDSGGDGVTQLAKKYVQDLNPYIRRDKIKTSEWNKAAFEANQWDGKQYGLVDRHTPEAMIINRALFRASGLPIPTGDFKHQDVLEWAKVMTKGSDDTSQFGVYHHTGQAPIYAAVWAHGGDIWTKDLKFGLTSEQAMAGLQWITDLWLKHQFSPDMTFRMMPGQAHDVLFRRGRIAQVLGSGTWIISMNDPEVDWAVTPMPIGPAGRGTVSYLAPNRLVGPAPNPDGGWEWIKYRVSEEGYLLGKGDVLAALPLLDRLIDHPKRLTVPSMTTRNLLAQQKVSARFARLPRTVPWAADAWQIITPALNEVWAGRKPVRAALKEIEAAVNQTISKPVMT